METYNIEDWAKWYLMNVSRDRLDDPIQSAEAAVKFAVAIFTLINDAEKETNHV